jgi:hypothetical protein
MQLASQNQKRLAIDNELRRITAFLQMRNAVNRSRLRSLRATGRSRSNRKQYVRE